MRVEGARHSATPVTDSWPAQEPRRAPHGMIASVNPLASAAGLRVLRAGGNALDAAVAAGAVLTVVEPWSEQLGGDAFLLIASAERKTVTAINGSGAAPLAATVDRYLAEGRIPESGWLAATVPGLVDAWRTALERHGTMSLGTLQAEGPSAFYRGGIADAIVAASDRAGGLFSQRDFAEHRTEILEPIGTTYRGWTVLEQPPVSQGLILLIALNILESAGVPSDPVDRVHVQVEAHKLALRERLSRVGDPRVSPTDLGPLLSKAHAAFLAGRIDQRRALPLQPEPAGHPDTTYLCVVDEARNVVSYIHS